jgi:hypothetical protein
MSSYSFNRPRFTTKNRSLPGFKIHLNRLWKVTSRDSLSYCCGRTAELLLSRRVTIDPAIRMNGLAKGRAANVRRQHVALCVLPFPCGMLFLTDLGTRARTEDPLQSFYIVRFFFSDDLSSWNHTFLDVTPVGIDVRVRVIHIALANASCDALLVRAAEHVVFRTTVAKVAGTDVCSNTEQSVEAALAAAKTSSTITEAASQIIVARCGVKEGARSWQFAGIAHRPARRGDASVSIAVSRGVAWSPDIGAATAHTRIYRRASGRRECSISEQ